MNKYYLLQVWLITTIAIALMCACIPDIRVYPLNIGNESLAFRLGLFLGILEFVFSFSVFMLIFLYLIFYLLTVKLRLSGIYVKAILIIFCLAGLAFRNHLDYPAFLFHPFFIFYSVFIVSSLIVLKVRVFDSYYA